MSDRAYAKAQAQQKTLIGSSSKNSLLQRTCACGQHTIAGAECSTCRSEKSMLLRSQRTFGPPSAPVAVQGNSPAQQNVPLLNSAFDRASRFSYDFTRIPIHSLQTSVPQTKLKVNQPGDVYEQEADQVAEQVMRTTDLGHSVSDDEDEAKTSLMRKQSSEPQADTGNDISSVPLVVHTVLNSGGGQPLDQATRAFMEPHFGHNFSRVRVHTDARAVNALAYTVGRDVVFGVGQYAPNTHVGQKLIAHELTHTIQQQNSQLAVADSLEHEREADTAADAVHSHRPIPTLKLMRSGLVSRQELQPDERPKIERSFELDPQRFLKSMEGPAVREVEKCEEFPGGSTDYEVDEETGTPTGKVTHRIDETNRCTRPCVEQHEAVHVKQLKTFCPKLRDCYLSADKGKRPVTECVKMAIFGMKERECEAYKVSVPCVENRLKNAKECQSKENKAYGTRKLASEKCFRNQNCGGSGGK